SLKFVYLCVRSKPERTRWQDNRSELRRPTRGVTKHRKVQDRLLAMGSGNGACSSLAEVRPPPRCEPFGGVAIERIAFRQYRFAYAYEIAQDAIDERSKRDCYRIKAGGADGEIDCGIVWNVEEKYLRRACDQRPFKLGCLTRRFLFQE